VTPDEPAYEESDLDTCVPSVALPCRACSDPRRQWLVRDIIVLHIVRNTPDEPDRWLAGAQTRHDSDEVTRARLNALPAGIRLLRGDHNRRPPHARRVTPGISSGMGWNDTGKDPSHAFALAMAGPLASLLYVWDKTDGE
jgi:hypothetical protein